MYIQSQVGISLEKIASVSGVQESKRQLIVIHTVDEARRLLGVNKDWSPRRLQRPPPTAFIDFIAVDHPIYFNAISKPDTNCWVEDLAEQRGSRLEVIFTPVLNSQHVF